MQHLIYFITNYIGTSIWWWVGVSSYQIYFQDTHIKQQLWALCSNISAQVVFGGAQRLRFHHTLLNIIFCWCSRLAGPQRARQCYFKLFFPSFQDTHWGQLAENQAKIVLIIVSIWLKTQFKGKEQPENKALWCFDSPGGNTMILLLFHFLNFTSNPQQTAGVCL